MFGLMLKSTHKAELQKARNFFDNTAKQLNTLNQQALDAERAIAKSLRADIEEMTPDYELGKQRRAQYQKDNAKRKERRAAKRVGV